MTSSFSVRLLQTVGATICIAFSLTQIVSGISCYDCSSRTDPRCGDPFDKFSIATVECSQKIMPHLDNMTASVCRKITQTVEGETRVRRGCGWIEEKTMDCYMRSGTYHVLMEYCACKGDFCNSASLLSPGSSWGSPLCLTIVLYVAFLMTANRALIPGASRPTWLAAISSLVL